MLLAIFIVTASVGAYYLASRAKITEFLWRRYPSWLEYWTLCAACSGLWYGAGAAAGLGYGLDWWFTPNNPAANIALGAALGLVWTPIIGALMVAGWMNLADVDEIEEDFEDDDED